jgi:hypothetical protein
MPVENSGISGTIVCDILPVYSPQAFFAFIICLYVCSPAKRAPGGGASGSISTGTLFANLFRCFLDADTGKALCPGRNTFKR